jgi:Holliday junction DNA helicase RuvA
VAGLPARRPVFSESSEVITSIRGKLQKLSGDTAALQVGAFEYEVLVPEFTRRQLQSRLDQEVSLHTIQYLEGNPTQGRLTPRLAGFLSPVEREFFEMFCSVDGVGVRKALRAMVRPVPEVAALIEQQDAKGLSTLPGIGPATAERVIAKLRRKMPKFALMVAQPEARAADVQPDIVNEAFAALRSLGHTETDARQLVDRVLTRKQKFHDVDTLIRAIYEQNR